MYGFFVRSRCDGQRADAKSTKCILIIILNMMYSSRRQLDTYAAAVLAPLDSVKVGFFCIFFLKRSTD